MQSGFVAILSHSHVDYHITSLYDEQTQQLTQRGTCNNHKKVTLILGATANQGGEIVKQRLKTEKGKKMTNQISTNKVGIPQPVKIFTWVLIVAGLFFAYVFTFNPGLTFPGAEITNYSSQLGFASTGVRVLGSVIALLISVLYNKPQWLFITLISRLVIEVGDISVGIATGGAMMNHIMIGVIALFELWAILRLMKSAGND